MSQLRFISILWVLLSITLSSWANNEHELFEQANKYYEEQQFEEAKLAYLQLLDKGHHADDIHYNLANAYFKTNQIASAILHYEKALKINPLNKDASYNLKIANEKTVDKIDAIPELFFYRWWKTIYHLLAVDQWAILSVVLFFLFSICFFLYLISNSIFQKKLTFYAAITSIVLGMFCWLLAAKQKRYISTAEQAIIMKATVNIISAPSEGSSQLFVLHEGTKVKIKDQTNGWTKVALPNGNEGWLENNAIEEI